MVGDRAEADPAELAFEGAGLGAQHRHQGGMGRGVEQHAGEVDRRGREDRARDQLVALEQPLGLEAGAVQLPQLEGVAGVRPAVLGRLLVKRLAPVAVARPLVPSSGRIRARQGRRG